MTQFPQYGQAEGGRWYAEVTGCPAETIANADAVRQAVQRALAAHGAPVALLDADVRDTPGGRVVGTVTGPSLMVTLHTWPEEAVATFDLYVYRAETTPEDAVRLIASELAGGQYQLWRGTRPERHVTGSVLGTDTSG